MTNTNTTCLLLLLLPVAAAVHSHDYDCYYIEDVCPEATPGVYIRVHDVLSQASVAATADLASAAASSSVCSAVVVVVEVCSAVS